MTAVWVRVACGLAAFSMTVILFAGAETAADISLFPAPFDKLAHFVYYGVVASLVAHAIGLRWLWLAFLLVGLVGVADEWNQSIVAGRGASLWDWIADVLGAAIFVYGYGKWAMKRRDRSETPAIGKS